MKGHYYLGRISRTHGKWGSVLIALNTDQPELYYRSKTLFIERAGRPFPLSIEKIKPLHRNKIKVDFKGYQYVDTAAEELVGKAVFLPLSSLPALSGNQFYYHEVIGFNTLTQGQSLGTIKRVKEIGTAQDLFVIDYGGSEILVPIVDEFIERVDREKREIHLKLPAGLLDLYR
ncbi:MAG: ribosome maturation factor RimM [Flavobacteriales bacterium]